jgi:hypothetical protein
MHNHTTRHRTQMGLLDRTMGRLNRIMGQHSHITSQHNRTIDPYNRPTMGQRHANDGPVMGQQDKPMPSEYLFIAMSRCLSRLEN